MPIYEYECRACAHRLEKLQKISDAPLLNCPECGADSLVKLVSAAGFRLKGGGWYETDFKKNGKRNLAGDGGGGDAKPAGDKAGSESAGSDKPAGKSSAGKTDSGSGKTTGTAGNAGAA